MTSKTRTTPVSMLPLFVAVVFLFAIAATTTGSTAIWGALVAAILVMGVAYGALATRSGQR